jgi:hypothetical protein
LDLETSNHKKNIVTITFSNVQNGGVIQDGTTNHCFILSGLVFFFYRLIFVFYRISLADKTIKKTALLRGGHLEFLI